MYNRIQQGWQRSRELLAQQSTIFLMKERLQQVAHDRGASIFAHRLRMRISILLLVLLSSVALLAWPLLAAVEFNYFDIFVTADVITLEWSTASEYNTAGFEVYCKAEDEADSAFHLIDQRVAQGGVDQGAIYRLDVTQGLEPGETYCFRLREITTDNTIGEVLQLCGYGLNITPTPQATATPFGSMPITSTGAFTTTDLTSTTNLTNAIGMTTTDFMTVGDNVGTVNQLPPFDLTATSEALFFTPTWTPTPVGGESALPTPDPFAVPPLPTVDPFAAPGIPPTTTQINTTTNNLQPDLELTNAALAAVAVPQVVMTPNPPYIVQTAPPTPTDLQPPPTFTPYPTAIALADNQLMVASLPSTQNLMMLLLCGIFSGASGLGILGLITTLLYMRSRGENKGRR